MGISSKLLLDATGGAASELDSACSLSDRGESAEDKRSAESCGLHIFLLQSFPPPFNYKQTCICIHFWGKKK